MKIMIAGDWHGNLSHAIRLMKIAKDQDISMVFPVGDFGFLWKSKEHLEILNDHAAEAGVEIWWLDGNHENYGLMGTLGADHVGEHAVRLHSHVQYLPRGLRFKLDGCRFMAFGGAISMDRNTRTPGWDYFFEESIKPYQVDAVSDEQVDIFLSHDAPAGASGLEFHGKFVGAVWPEDAMRDAAFNRDLLAEVVDRVEPKLIVHGHYHHRYRGVRRGAEVIGLGRDDSGKDSYIIIDTEDYRG